MQRYILQVAFFRLPKVAGGRKGRALLVWKSNNVAASARLPQRQRGQQEWKHF